LTLSPDQHVNHLCVLVDCAVRVGPDPVDFDVGLVDEPAVPGQVPREAGGLDQQRCEPLHPPVERHMIDLDAALGQQFL